MPICRVFSLIVDEVGRSSAASRNELFDEKGGGVAGFRGWIQKPNKIFLTKPSQSRRPAAQDTMQTEKLASALSFV